MTETLPPTEDTSLGWATIIQEVALPLASGLKAEVMNVTSYTED